jgi:addiction module RelE/StbE family toxin
VDIRWTDAALDDLDEAGAFIAQDRPAVAPRFASRIIEAIELLTEFPNLGRGGRVKGTRELVISGTPFVAVYRVQEGEAHVLRLLHHARQWPP